MKAYFCSEERFVRLSICFDSLESKNKINKSIEELAKKYELEPYMEIQCCGEDNGELTVEFEDDYNQEAKPFFQELCENLGLEFEASCSTKCCSL